MLPPLTVTILKDAHGYGVESVPDEPTEGLILGRRSGVYIVGRGGWKEFRTYDTGQQLQLWKKIIRIRSPDALAAFMSNWGPVTRWDVSWPFNEPYSLLKPVLDGLRNLAGHVDALDRTGFVQSLGPSAGVLQLQADENGNWYPTVKTLAQFAVVEMVQTFEGDRPAHLGFRACQACGELFPVGGRRKQGNRRRDALYCDDKCRKAAHARKASARKVI